jgi:carbon monoxide dehydrogenase subunit G
MKLKFIATSPFSYIALLLKCLSVIVLITGCASYSSVYPNYKIKPKIAVSTETISILTEIPAGDYLIPKSQVFIGGSGKLNPASAIFGIVGVMANITIIQSGNESSADSSNLHVKFDSQLTAALNREITYENYSSKLQIVNSEDTSDIILLPSAKFQIQDDSRAQLIFTLTVRFKDDVSRNSGKKTYEYAIDDIRPFSGKGGWIDNNATLFKEAQKLAINLLAQVFLEDMTGKFKSLLESDNQLVLLRGSWMDIGKFKSLLGADDQPLLHWKTTLYDQAFTVLLVREHPTYLFISQKLKKTGISK